jgi:hypothetical protein
LAGGTLLLLLLLAAALTALAEPCCWYLAMHLVRGS